MISPVICPRCYQENAPDARSCTNCGASVGGVCEQCGRDVLPGEAMCEGCGHPVRAAGTPPPKGNEPFATSQVHATLTVEKGMPDVVQIPLEGRRYLLGKSTQADIVVNNPYVSREHAEIVVLEGKFRIRDLGSTNGTFVNSQRMKGEARLLVNGDRIELVRGQVVFLFRDEGPSTLRLGRVASSPALAAAQPAAGTPPEGTVTMMFSDIEGYTAITERLGDRRAQEVLHDHNGIVREQIESHGGFEVKSQGDSFMVAFPSARRALLCAMGIQRALAAYREGHPDNPIHVRIGLHTGEAIKEKEDFFGKDVILSARIADRARGDQILVSALLKQLTESAGDIKFGEAQEVELKGLSGIHRLYPVPWQ